jgi:hypothetical protein
MWPNIMAVGHNFGGEDCGRQTRIFSTEIDLRIFSGKLNLALFQTRWDFGEGQIGEVVND